MALVSDSQGGKVASVAFCCTLLRMDAWGRRDTLAKRVSGPGHVGVCTSVPLSPGQLELLSILGALSS